MQLSSFLARDILFLLIPNFKVRSGSEEKKEMNSKSFNSARRVG